MRPSDPRALLVSVILALGLLAAACGGGATDDAAPGARPADADADAGTAPDAASAGDAEPADAASPADAHSPVDAAAAPPAPPVATTTLTAETSNNTSAATSFVTLPNGDIAPANVSKVSLKKLLPAGYRGKVLAHWMPWWTCSKTPCDGVHDSRDDVRVHYSTEDAAQIDRTLEDMISRGYDGVMVAEANSGGVDTASTRAMAAEMPKYPGFSFSISENHLDAISGASAQLTQLLADMKDAASTYFTLANYLTVGGRPVVYVFDDASIDWAAAASSAAGHPLFVLDGPSHATTTLGGFYWFGGLPQSASLTSGEALGNLDAFYQTVAANPGRLYSGSFFKGFDDAEATWTMHRKIDQACGLTFVRSLSAMASAPASAALLQVATWDDYEEGTEVETGIDNCAAAAASVSGTVVTPVASFTSVGSVETVDHFTVYLSTDGENLIDAGDVAVAAGASLDTSALGLPAGTYRAFVKMVGKSHIVNHLSPPVSLTIP